MSVRTFTLLPQTDLFRIQLRKIETCKSGWTKLVRAFTLLLLPLKTYLKESFQSYVRLLCSPFQVLTTYAEPLLGRGVVALCSITVFLVMDLVPMNLVLCLGLLMIRRGMSETG